MANTKITNPELFNLGDSTSATQLPVMTTTQRIAMNAAPTSNIDYLVVAGGGAGGGGGQAGGGGAGGLRTNYGGASLTLNTATAYTVTVGAGGIGTGNGVSGSGSNSVFDYITSTITSAGGGGGAIHNISGADGGSGGGAGTQQTGGSGNTPSTTPSQGNAGGSGGTYDFPYSGGGGGGYVSVGSTGGNVSGNGGTGIAYTAANSITGSALSLAGGGGGGTYSGAAGTATNGGGAGFSGTGTTAYGSPGTPGTDNTGGGGGGTGNYQVGTIGASGGSGIVILRYPTADIASYTATGLTPTETTDGTDTILSFTTVGTGAITFTSSTPTGTISTGEMIFNSTTDKVEYWDGTKWYGITYEVDYLYNNILWTGDGTNNRIITGLGFTPDFVWIKNRATNDSHQLFDSLRDENLLYSNGADQQFFIPDWEIINDGFDLGSAYPNGRNGNGNDIVAWCWKAGGAAAANTDGTLASQVSANAADGFSIVTGSAPSNGYTNTFGHGLGQQPDIIITKLTNVASDWFVIFPKMSNGLLKLNTTGSFTYDSLFAGTSTTLKTGYTTAAFDFVAYCFASVPGYSKIGSYTGNGTTGQLIPTGFQPRYLLVKSYSASGSYYDWYIFDNKRGDAYLKANKYDSEQQSPTYNPTFESTGFRWEPGDNSGGWNGSGVTYIYMTFA